PLSLHDALPICNVIAELRAFCIDHLSMNSISSACIRVISEPIVNEQRIPRLPNSGEVEIPWINLIARTPPCAGKCPGSSLRINRICAAIRAPKMLIVFLYTVDPNAIYFIGELSRCLRSGISVTGRECGVGNQL